MKDGHVQQIDAPLNLYNNPVNKFVGGFIGSPSMNFFKGSVVDKQGLRFVQDGEGFEFAIPSHLQRHLDRSSTQPVVVGLRPEHIALKEEDSLSAAVGVVRANVEVVEPMGNEIYLYFSTQKSNDQFVARVGTSRELAVDTEIDLTFDLSRLHLFDSQSEQRIG
jgi:multiple sugar transport system ATP-binding protein